MLIPWLAAAPPVTAADSTPSEPKNEIVVFGGYSLLDATRGEERTLSFPDGPGLLPPIFPERPGGITLPPISIQLRAGTSLGGSPLFGFRYSRQIKERLWVEADFEVAPSHDLETSGEVCLQGGRCFGTGEFGRGEARRVFPDLDFDALRSRQVTAWNYGAGLAYELNGRRRAAIADPGSGRCVLDRSPGGLDQFRPALRSRGESHVRPGGDAPGGCLTTSCPTSSSNGKGEHDVHITGGLLAYVSGDLGPARAGRACFECARIRA